MNLVLEILLRVVGGLVGGLIVGGGFSLIATAIFVVGGAGAFEASGLALLGVIAVYLLGFGTAGVIAGLLSPLARWRIGAALVGLCAAVPACTLMVMSFAGWPLEAGDVMTVLIGSVAFGPTFGVYLWHENQKVEQGLHRRATDRPGDR